MTNRVIAFVCLLGVSGALGQAQDFAQQTSDYYRGKREHRGDIAITMITSAINL